MSREDKISMYKLWYESFIKRSTFTPFYMVTKFDYELIFGCEPDKLMDATDMAIYIAENT